MRDDTSMTDENMARVAAEEFEERVVRSLERQPEVSIPADFAARVASQVPGGQAPLPVETEIRETHYGRRMMMVSMVVLLAAMLALAPRAVGNSALWTGLQWTLCGQFVLLALWFVMRRDRLR